MNYTIEESEIRASGKKYAISSVISNNVLSTEITLFPPIVPFNVWDNPTGHSFRYNYDLATKSGYTAIELNMSYGKKRFPRSSQEVCPSLHDPYGTNTIIKTFKLPPPTILENV